MEETSNGLLTDDVLAVCQLLYNEWDVATKNCVTETPILSLLKLLVDDFLEALPLLWHPHYHVKDIERIENNLEVLISEQLNKEVKEPLRVHHHVLWVALNTITYIPQDFIDGLCTDPPVVLCIHHPLDLLHRDKLTARQASM